MISMNHLPNVEGKETYVFDVNVLHSGEFASVADDRTLTIWKGVIFVFVFSGEKRIPLF